MTKTKKAAKVEQGEPRKVSFVHLGTTEQNVMVQLAQQRSIDMVSLAAGLWRTTPDWKAFDPYPLLNHVIDTLSARGLVKFRLARPYGERTQQATDIRLTPDGWTLMGFPNVVVEAGTRSRHAGAPTKRADGTNYRNQPFHAIGGAIEKDTFPQHRLLFPSHIHMYGDNQLTLSADESGDMTRPYTRVTPDVEASVISARDRLGPVSYADIAERTGVPERTVKYILVDLPRLRRTNSGEGKAEGSLKERIMSTVKVLGEVKDVGELRRILGMADDEHSVMHTLHSLHTQGRIDFTERGNGMGTATVVNIRLPKKGRRNGVAPTAPKFVQDRIPEQAQPLPVVSRQEEEQRISAEAKQRAEELLGRPVVDATDVTVSIIEPEATTDGTPVPPPSAPGSDTGAYPLLTDLLDRERKRGESDAKALAYITAADALRGVDEDAMNAMLLKATELDATFPAPLEQEYMRYVADHPDNDARPDVQAQAEGD